jgi:integrase
MAGKQAGYLYRKGKNWFVRFYDTVLVDGRPVRKQIAKRIASAKEFRTRKAVQPLVAELLLPINTGMQPVEATARLGEFVQVIYMPYVQSQLRPSTARSYADLWRVHLAPRCAHIRIRDFRTVDGERLLAAIARQTSLTRTSLRNIKSLLSAIFRHTKRLGLLNGVNPVQDCSVPKGKESPDTYAYPLPQIAKMIAVLPEPASTIVALAAFTGLRKGELRGLRWEDVKDGQVYVCQSAWNSHVTEPKTKSSKAPVPLISYVAQVIERHRERQGATNGFLFATCEGKPLNLDNLALRVIRPTLNKAGIEWHGWHGFRRGLATNLHSLGIPDKTIQAILRHSSVAITQSAYIKTVDGAAAFAMKVLEAAWGNDFVTETVN